jgi:hypothetical protein
MHATALDALVHHACWLSTDASYQKQQRAGSSVVAQTLAFSTADDMVSTADLAAGRWGPRVSAMRRGPRLLRCGSELAIHSMNCK